jgi:6-phosphogluconolactonase (cycloisomerase 2 family)
MTTGLALYSAVDEVLTCYGVDADAATLERQSPIVLPAKVQYAWPHPSLRVLFVSTSDGGPRVPGEMNHVSAFRIEPDGTLSPLGAPVPLRKRAVHMCVDSKGRFALNAHNFQMGDMSVHGLGPDGALLPEIPQLAGMDLGNYPHQVMVFPSGRTALIVDRGNNAQAGKPEDPGALRAFDLDNGVLCATQVVAPDGGYGFGPRHVDFHPSQPWLYVSDERTNRLYMFRHGNDRLEPEPAFVRGMLREPANMRPRQLGGAIHVHPNGRFVYAANRCDHSVDSPAGKVFAGGENNIAVYAIDQAIGEPTLIQHADMPSFHVRTFAIDPSGRLLVAASIKALQREVAGSLEAVPAALSVFRIANDGRLEFVRKIDVETPGSRLQYWMGIVATR